MIKPLFDVFRASMMNNPKGSRKEARETFIASIGANPDYLSLLAEDYFNRMAALWTVRAEKHGHSFVRLGASVGNDIAHSRKRRAEGAALTDAAVRQLKAQIRPILLDLVLPNGKMLRHSTGAECAKAGGFFAEVAKHLKPTEVVDRHLSEAQVGNLYDRFYKATTSRNVTKRKAA